MSILHDPAEPVRFQPRPDGPVYLLRVPRVIDRAVWQREIRKMGGRRWGPLDMAATLKDGINAVLAGSDETTEEREERERWIGYIDQYTDGVREAMRRWRDERSSEMWQAVVKACETPPELVAITEQIAAEHEPYAARVGDNEVHDLIAGTAFTKHFLVGWEGKNLPPFRRGRDGPSEQLLRRIPSGDLIAIGVEGGRLMMPDEDELKNSDSGSGGSSDQTPLAS